MFLDSRSAHIFHTHIPSQVSLFYEECLPALSWHQQRGQLVFTTLGIGAKGRRAKHAPLIPASWVCLGPKYYYYHCSRPRPPRQRPVVALAAGAVRAVRPCGAVSVAPRGAALRVALRLGVMI